jgi:molecular chaperone GrpE
MTAMKKPTHHQPTKDELEKEVAELKHALEISEESRTRLASDYANLERRFDQEKAEIGQRAGAVWLSKLFPIMDNFYRAATHAPTISTDGVLDEDELGRIHKYFEGLKQIEKQLEETLAHAGLIRIKSKGEQFDPNMHEAISYEESTLPAETIIDEVEGGWLLNDSVLKPAKVRVSKG